MSIARAGRISAILASAVISLGQTATADELFTVAGTGEPGLSGDGGPAVDAQLNQPHSVVADSAGNLYVADLENNLVRKVDVNGDISVFAGGGTIDDDQFTGLATDVILAKPVSIDVDAADNVYFLDFDNRVVRKVDTAGNISTVAGNGNNGTVGDGGLATSASFNFPWAISVDSAGNIYIADRANDRIRMVDVATGVIDTVAGGDANGDEAIDPLGDGGQAVDANLNAPHGVFADDLGNIYISDTFNQRVRMVNGMTGIISTIAGDGIAAFRDNVPAIEGRFRQPRGLHVNAAGEIFIADWNNHRIRKIGIDGIITTIAGTGLAGFNGDGQLATESDLNNPNDVFVDAAGDVFVADVLNARVRVMTADTANSPPTDITLDNDTILSSAGVDAVVGTLSTTDADTADVHVYSLVAGTGDTDNGLFSITGDQLTANDASAMGGSYSIRVMTDDQVDASFIEVLMVNVTDDVAPVIALTGDDPQLIDLGGTYTELGATASDNIDGDLTAAIDIDASAVDTTTPGDYTVSYSVTDAAGNQATANRTVTVADLADTTPPVITLLGDNPQVITVGSAYMELGATATDNIDGDLSTAIVIDSSAVNTAVAGSYSVTYDVTDAAGNAATTATRTVTVQAAPPPPPPPPPPPTRSGGGSMGIPGLLLLLCVAIRRRSAASDRRTVVRS